MRHFSVTLSAIAVLALGVAAAQARPASAITFNSRRAFNDLRRIVAFGPRPAGSAALARTRRYIEGQLRAAGVRYREQPFVGHTPIGPIHMVNIVATIPGRSPDRLLITGHYDTKLERTFRFVGADDGGSSAAFLLEIARDLAHHRGALTVQIVFFDGEEAVVSWKGTDHTYGSRHFVNAARADGTLERIKAMVLVDMIGDRNLDISRDDNSTTWLTNIIWNTASRLGFGSYFLNRHTQIEDDHIPFINAGIPAVDIIDLDYPPWHTAGDTLDKVSARSLQIVGNVVLAALPQLEARAMREP